MYLFCATYHIFLHNIAIQSPHSICCIHAHQPAVQLCVFITIICAEHNHRIRAEIVLCSTAFRYVPSIGRDVWIELFVEQHNQGF